MYKIYKLRINQPIDFAAEELKKYLRMMMPTCGEIEITYDPEATDGFRLGFLPLWTMSPALENNQFFSSPPPFT